MTRMRKRLLEDFIIPSLNDERYGNKLCWINKSIGTFRLFWSHKNAAKWTMEDTVVFQDWDKLKGHYKPEGSNYFMCAKQRFRAALYKLSPYVRALTTGDKYHREYQLIFDGNKRSENLVRPKKNVPKRAHQSSIPTSVIRKNTSYIARPHLKDQKSMSPSLDFYGPGELQILAQYSSSREKLNQLRLGRQYENRTPEESPQKSSRDVHETSVLRENSSISRIPHVAPQPVPIYCSYKQYPNPHNRIQECPPIFVSKLYIGPENVPQQKDNTLSSSYTTDDEMCSGILNLSVKSEPSTNAPSR